MFILLSVSQKGCFHISEPEVSSLKNLQITEIKKEYAALQLSAHIKNPNKFRFKITEANLSLFVNEVEVGKVVEFEKVVIPASSDQDYTFDLKVDLSEMKSNLLTMIAGFFTKKSGIKVSGYIKVRSLFISRKIYFEDNNLKDLLK